MKTPILIAAVACLSACASPASVMLWPSAAQRTSPTGTPQRLHVTSPAPHVNGATAGMREATFPVIGSAPDPARPETLAQFALNLAEQGELRQAATFLVEAADHQASGSERQAFRVACLAGAASLYLQANDLESFQKLATRLRRQLDRFQLASADRNVSTLLAVADVLEGRKLDGANLPWVLRDIKPAPGR